jgi:hypothetical protein
MTGSPDEIGTWFQMEPHYDFQKELWRCGNDGTVLAVEQITHPWHSDGEADWQAVLLPENHTEDAEPIDVLTSRASRGEAIERAHDFMRDNQDGS